VVGGKLRFARKHFPQVTLATILAAARQGDLSTFFAHECTRRVHKDNA